MSLLLMSAGRGPEECCWAVAELAALFEADAARHKVTVRRVETVAGERRGTYRSILFDVDSAAFADSWAGTLCWQAASPYRTGHGRKNWYVIARPVDGSARSARGAAVDSAAASGSTREPSGSVVSGHAPQAGPDVGPRLDEADVDFVPVRTGGPGGQHRNKASTAVRATHRPSGLVVVVDSERRLSLNRRLAVDLLRRRLGERHAATVRAAGAARRHVHDELVRGNPTKTFRLG